MRGRRKSHKTSLRPVFSVDNEENLQESEELKENGTFPNLQRRPIRKSLEGKSEVEKLITDRMTSVGSRKRTRDGDVKHNTELEDEAPSAKRASCTIPAPFHTDEAAGKSRAECDYGIKITMEMGQMGTAPRPIRVYADGIYDMFHSGHARQLMQAKTCFPGNVYLLVGVCNDELTHSMKGRTVMNETERYEAVRHCRYVDELVSDAPWLLDDDFLEKHKIDFVAHDDLPYGAGDAEDIYKWLKDRDMFVATQRTEGISTTDVISRIIKDYDMYIRRNLARGYTAKDLNVGFMKEKTIQFQEKIDTMKERGHKLMDKLHDKRDEIFNKWEERSREFVSNFVDLFGREGRINHWYSETKRRVSRAISPPASPSRLEDKAHSSTASPPRKRGRAEGDVDSDSE